MKKLAYLGLISLLALSLAACGGASGRSRDGARAVGNVGNSSERAVALTNLGAALLSAGEPHKALSELLEARKLDPRNPNLENYIGQTYYLMNEYDLAAESYQKALSFDDKRTDVRNNLGLVYFTQKKYDQALAEFKICMKDLIYKNKEKPLTNMGLTYMAMGDYGEAMTVLRRATEVAPNYAKSYQLIGQIHLAEGRTKEGIDYLNNAVKLNPSDPESLMLVGDAQMQLGRREEAAQSYSRAAALVPNSSLALEAQKKARQAMGFD